LKGNFHFRQIGSDSRINPKDPKTSEEDKKRLEEPEDSYHAIDLVGEKFGGGGSRLFTWYHSTLATENERLLGRRSTRDDRIHPPEKKNKAKDTRRSDAEKKRLTSLSAEADRSARKPEKIRNKKHVEQTAKRKIDSHGEHYTSAVPLPPYTGEKPGEEKSLSTNTHVCKKD